MVWLRRESKMAVLLLIVGVVLTGCGGGQERLNVYNWTEYIPEDVLEEFAEEFDIRLVYDNFSSNEEMYAKLKAGGGGYDITFPSQDFVPLMIEENMLMELDLSKIPNFRLLDPQVQKLNNYDPGFRFSVPYSFGASGIVYWKDRIGTIEPSWDSFLLPEVQGKLVLMDDMREVLGAALKSLGYSLNTTNPGEIFQARDLVNRWKPGIVKFDNDIISSGFATKEFLMVFSYPENALAELEEADLGNVEIFFPREGGGLYLDSMVILRDAKNVDMAYNFVNFILRPEIYARIMDAFGYPGLVPSANALRKSAPLYTAEDLPNHEFRLDVGPAIELYNRAWQEVRVGL